MTIQLGLKMCAGDNAFRNRSPTGSLVRNYPYVNDSHKVAQRYPLSQNHLPMESGQLNIKFTGFP